VALEHQIVLQPELTELPTQVAVVVEQEQFIQQAALQAAPE